MKKMIAFSAAIAASLLFASCEKDKDDEKVIVISAAGSIDDDLQTFKKLLGGSLNTTPGATGGFREVNWDGVPKELIGKPMPNDFFNTPGNDVPASRQRGIVYQPGEGEFRVSATNFKEVNGTTEGEFAAFSGANTFANVSAPQWILEPEVPGLRQAATIKGFGMVFSDVDVANSTSLEFFSGEKSLGRFFAPAHNQQSSFSFLGVYFRNEKVTSVQVRHKGVLVGGSKDISDGGTDDLVILDNFLYDEPVKNRPALLKGRL